MKDILDPETEISALNIQTEQPSTRQSAPFPRRSLDAGIWLLILLAFVTGAALLLADLLPHLLTIVPHAPISAAPLLLIGAASLAFQALLRPKLLDLFKALLVSLAFIFWGIDQMLPAGWFTTTLGDIVIILYVIDLGWMMGDTLRKRQR